MSSDYGVFSGDFVFLVVFGLPIILMSGVAIGVGLRFSHDIEAGIDPPKGIRYQPTPGLYYALPATILLCILFLVFEFHGLMFFRPVFLFVCLYECLLLLFLPLLRRFISAKACGWLWTLPNMPMYFYMVSFRMVSTPVFAIPLPAVLQLVPKFLWPTWVIGFALVMLWQIISHIIFKMELLKHARPVTDENLIEIWAKEQTLANFPGNSFKLRISPRTKTPLSIGLFNRTICVILPEREYTPEELSLIIRHELIHIGRKDNVHKFFMLFVTALFWFNPFMWIAMRCSADDLELSCDETVLLGCNQRTRHQYAELLLSTAADQRGYTTCLSASARALRYRLKNSMLPRKRWRGGMLMGLLFVVLCVAIIFGDFSYNPGTAAERIFENQDPKAYTCTEVTLYDNGKIVDCPNVDTEVIMTYLFGLPVSQLMRRYENMGLYKGTQIIVETQEDKYVLWLSDRYLRVRTYDAGNPVETCYILQEQTDWQDITSLLSL